MPMDAKDLFDALMMYVGLVGLLSFHEFGHAWMAWKCGDDTARRQGRLSLNPLVHIDVIGTVVMPLLMIFLSAGGSELGRYLIGWAKPVPVNIDNLRNRRFDDILVSMAGPWMNLFLAIGLMALARAGVALGAPALNAICQNLALLSLVLCFFNLLPVPPLDGSQVVRSIIGMSYETYWKLARFGFLIVIVVMQIPAVRKVLHSLTGGSYRIMAEWFAVPRVI
jgi:Zn-dependent protease